MSSTHPDLKHAIALPLLCHTHQRLLVMQCGYGPNDTWRALMIATQLALFQGATCDADTYEKIGGDVHRIGELGCLACWKPDRFGAIIEAIGTSHDIGRIKALAEAWVKASAKSPAIDPPATGPGELR